MTEAPRWHQTGLGGLRRHWLSEQGVLRLGSAESGKQRRLGVGLDLELKALAASSRILAVRLTTGPSRGVRNRVDVGVLLGSLGQAD